MTGTRAGDSASKATEGRWRPPRQRTRMWCHRSGQTSTRTLQDAFSSGFLRLVNRRGSSCPFWHVPTTAANVLPESLRGAHRGSTDRLTATVPPDFVSIRA